MAVSAFKTNPVALSELLKNCADGALQLPDFQRSWVWDEERIRSLIASVSRAFPVGAIMTLEVGGGVEFKPRPVEGAPKSARSVLPSSLILDGQQRMTSLYQVTMRGEVVNTITAKKKHVKRWFYIDMEKALNPSIDREEAIIGVPEDKVVKKNFGREVELDLSTQAAEFQNLMFPLSSVFDSKDWMDAYLDHIWDTPDRDEKRAILRRFDSEVLTNFSMYQVPVIALDKSTSKEAVCVVFEKVNTGGKPLDAFELITAMYAADGYELRKDWYGDEDTKGRRERFLEAYRPAEVSQGILANIGNTDFLQVISLLHTRDRRVESQEAGAKGKELAPISANRAALLNLPLSAYKRYQDKAEDGFMKAARFLYRLNIFRPFDLPYQSQIIPLAAILADLGEAWESAPNRIKIEQWYWNGVFGELYGSTTETRIARDFSEVPDWLSGGPVPSTIRDATFRADRLLSMKMRLSAAYKGVNALLMNEGARDFRTGQAFGLTAFFDENVDIHHIFPQKWCEDQGIPRGRYDSIINKTPLTARTNRIIGGDAPSRYLSKLEGGHDGAGVPASELDRSLLTHLIDPKLLRTDDFEEFMTVRQRGLVGLIEAATGQPVYVGDYQDEGSEEESDSVDDEAAHTIAP